MESRVSADHSKNNGAASHCVLAVQIDETAQFPANAGHENTPKIVKVAKSEWVLIIDLLSTQKRFAYIWIGQQFLTRAGKGIAPLHEHIAFIRDF